jgi:AcrR family transcriptional regulator
LEDHQRERVLDAAIDTFAKRGYQATTVDHIISAAKIGVGSFYELFSNKQDCFMQSYERIIAPAGEEISAAIPPEGSWGEKACAALRRLLELIEAEPMQAKLALVEVQTAGDVALGRYEEVLYGFVPLLARGREESPVAEELPARLEEAIVGGLAWFLQQRVVLGELDSASLHLGDVLEIAVEPYLGEAATAELLAQSSS